MIFLKRFLIGISVSNFESHYAQCPVTWNFFFRFYFYNLIAQFQKPLFWDLSFCADTGGFLCCSKACVVWSRGYTRARLASVNHRVYHAFPLWSNEWNVMNVNLTLTVGLRTFLWFFLKQFRMGILFSNFESRKAQWPVLRIFLWFFL